ncbi:MAG: hypothetical protein QNI84_14200 [Henriciella sp.]|nr:hypothetical protein [Henriciella sp.]
MMLVGNQRGGAADLAVHLMKPENEHIEVYELRGFVSDDLHGAFKEIEAISRGTHCKQFLYSLSLNPPEDQSVPTDAFEAAIERVEAKLGLTDQPRAIVFHEKKGRRHAHCVWSRINVVEMKAIQMSFDREKLKPVSRDLFIEHGWKMPAGLANRANRDPRNYSLAEWQQARRIQRHPNEIKREFEDAWALSDSKAAFIHALEERGYRVARGNKDRPVAVDAQGEVFAIARKAGVKTKDVRSRLGDMDDLPDVDTVKTQMASEMGDTINRLKDELEQQFQKTNSEYEMRRNALVDQQRCERQTLKDKLEKRQAEESRKRQSRFRKGVAGFWDRLNGKHRQIKTQNELDAQACQKRDAKAKDALVFKHLQQRQRLALFKISLRRSYGRERSRLEYDQRRFSGPEVLP